MPRPKQILSAEHINEILEAIENAEAEAFQALRKFLNAELDRRRYAGNLGGRPKSPIDAATRNRENVRRHRARKKAEK